MAFRFEDLLLWGGTLSSLSAFVAVTIHVRGGGADHRGHAQRLMGGSALFFLISLAVLFFGRLMVDPVWAAVATVLSTQPGFWLAWTGSAALALWINALRWSRQDLHEVAQDARHPLPWTMVIGSLVVVAMGLGTLLYSPFGAAPGNRGPGSMDAAFALHRGLLAMAYGVAALLFSCSTAHVITQRKEWADIALPWARAAVLLLALSLGAWMWIQNQEVGPPGAWVWVGDDLHQALVLGALLVLIHGLIYYRKKRMMRLLAPVSALAAFPLALPVGSAAHLVDFFLAVIVAAPLAYVLGRKPSAAEAVQEPFLDRWIMMNRLVYLGMVVLTLSMLSLVALSILAARRGRWGSLEDVIPLVPIPALLILGVALSNQAIGRRRSLWLGGAAVAVGAVFALVAPDDWATVLLAPILSFALFGACTKLLKVSDPGPRGDLLLRWVGSFLLFGAIASLVFWLSPPGKVDPFAFSVPSQFRTFATGASLIALLSAPFAMKAVNYRVALVGSLALAASMAWGFMLAVGAVLAVAVAARPAAFSSGVDRWDLGKSITSLERDLRKTGTYLIHVALVLGLAGFALGTLRPGSEGGAFGDYVGGLHLLWASVGLIALGIALVLAFGGWRLDSVERT